MSNGFVLEGVDHKDFIAYNMEVTSESSQDKWMMSQLAQTCVGRDAQVKQLVVSIPSTTWLVPNHPLFNFSPDLEFLIVLLWQANLTPS